MKEPSQGIINLIRVHPCHPRKKTFPTLRPSRRVIRRSEPVEGARDGEKNQRLFLDNFFSGASLATN
jgi:hypothetical protein